MILHLRISGGERTQRSKGLEKRKGVSPSGSLRNKCSPECKALSSEKKKEGGDRGRRKK